jgi:hypothetical protein
MTPESLADPQKSTPDAARTIPAWSWADILRTAPRLGIPHFQRGLVWDTSNRVALLESLYDGAPCGMFVTWRPTAAVDPCRVGISVLTGELLKSSDALWLVDGQQRTRTLISIFRDCLQAERNGADGADDAPARQPLLPAWVMHSLKELLPYPAVADEPGEDESSDVDDSPSSAATDAKSTPGAASATAAAEHHDDSPSTEAQPGKGNASPSWFVSLAKLLPPSGASADWWSETATSPRVARYSAFRTFQRSSLIGRSALAPAGLLPLGLFFGDDDPFAPERVRRYLEVLAGEDLDALQRELPWGPLWLTGKAEGWVTLRSASQRAPLLDWMKDLAAEHQSDPATGPFTTVLRRLHGLFRQPRFALGELPASDLPTAIAAYVRINRAGVRVRDEERAMAVLMRIHPGLLDDLAKFLKDRDSRSDLGGDIRQSLSHASDKAFGFGLWMQVVSRYVVLAECGEKGTRWLGADVLERWSVKDRLDKASEAPATQSALNARTVDAVARASCALLLLDRILDEQLFLDHRMARPDVQQGWPLLEIFSCFSVHELGQIAEHESARQALGHTLMLTMLGGPLARGTMQAICDVIHGAKGSADGPPIDRLGKLLRAFVAKLPALRKKDGVSVAGPPLLWLRAAAKENFEKLVKESRSLQSAAVGWLYAIEKRNKAADFHWPAQIRAAVETDDLLRASDKGGSDDFLCRGVRNPKTPEREAAPLAAVMYDSVHPEKQHIVPFSDAREILEKKTGTRASSSEANDVGNLTWLSALQNGFEFGFSDHWMVLDDPADRANLLARGFVDPEVAGTTAAEIFERMGETIALSENSAPKAQDDFKTFREYRRA